MDFTSFTSIKSQFTSNPNLCELFRLLSVETWKRIEYAYIKTGIKVFETTITQNLIFSINAYKDQFGLNIDVFEALDEKTNGNDFELIVRFPDDDIEYYTPIQAKKVNRDGKYSSMEHGVQIESFLKYAELNNAKPMYLLYNYAASPIRSGITLSSPAELTGCAFVSAEYLFNHYYNKRTKKDGSLAWRIPHFYDLNPNNAFPWHEFVCPPDYISFYKVLQKHNLVSPIKEVTSSELISSNSNLKQGFYPLGTFKKEGWVEIGGLSVSKKDFEYKYQINEPHHQIKAIDLFEKSSQIKVSEEQKIYTKFSPKSRIVLSK